MFERLKTVTGIKCANCLSCENLGSEDDGGEPGSAISWAICREHPSHHNLKSFPFKTEMTCWRPEFWHSKFADEIENGEHEELMLAATHFREACDAVSQNTFAQA